MIATPTRRSLLAGALATLAAAPARAQGPRLPARVRIIGGMLEPAGTMLAGLSVQLDAGWKTYWRMPGDSGLPPTFDWQGSRNLRAAEVFYPAPERLSDGFGEILAYRSHVVFPVRVAPVDPGKAVDLVLDLHFGVCEQVCVPAQIRVQTSLGRMSPPAADTALIGAHMARVPRPMPAGTAVRAWRVDRPAGALTFTAEAPGVRHAVVEALDGPAFRLPELRRDGAALALRVPLEPDHRGAVRVTVVTETGGIEETWRLDG